MNRNLDGVYFRINRDGKWCNVCFTDLTRAEREEVLKDRSVEWLKQLCHILAVTMQDIGETFDLFGGATDE